MVAIEEDKQPPGSNRHTKKSGLSTGAAYLARKTLVLIGEFFRERYNTSIMLTKGKLDMRTYAKRQLLQYPCTATAIASIAHWHSFLFLLRLAWTKDGWVDTSEWEDLWDDDAYYAHLDDLDFD